MDRCLPRAELVPLDFRYGDEDSNIAIFVGQDVERTHLQDRVYVESRLRVPQAPFLNRGHDLFTEWSPLDGTIARGRGPDRLLSFGSILPLYGIIITIGLSSQPPSQNFDAHPTDRGRLRRFVLPDIMRESNVPSGLPGSTRGGAPR